MFKSQFSKSDLISEYQKKLHQIHQSDEIRYAQDYSKLLNKLAQAANHFDAIDQTKLAEKTSQILEILSTKFSPETLNNQKLAQVLEKNNLLFSAPEDIIELD